MPKIIGQLQATADKKASSTRTKLWSFEELKNYLSDMESHALGNRLLNIVDWAKLRGALKSLWRSWKTFVIKRVKVRGN
ncbi:MAG: hypothetical protein D5R97_05660 [Candidatus Syntrophonatronum acetioxidans]|uniref:Uncharacterized protein n=1 Tax=Candidatus Syntrophonatronum acetioxidans TaxID=1795816 RepID=A0A424YE49_9FIRM|nr:MAG: hypothetical protein D5R97_05660 [Candidatus Syntrophonatronum acetioxidans]